MKLELKGSLNYCATIVKVDKLIPIDGADKILKAIVMNNSVVVSKDINVGDIGVFFPVETMLSKEFLYNNSLYRDKELNLDKTKAGFFELNGRIRCLKLRGVASEGLFLPLSSFNYITSLNEKFNIGDEFDTIDGNKICEKFINTKNITNNNNNNTSKGKKPKKVKKISKLVDGMFRLHYNTAQMKKNLHNINKKTIISISEKIHGTSLVVANIPTKKQLSLKDKIAKKIFGCNIVETKYDMIYSSRTVVKNEFMTTSKEMNSKSGYYKEDIWGNHANEVFPLLQKGMTAYCEIVGYLSNGGHIQKDYIYGCEPMSSKCYVYRITLTNEDGKVVEMPFMQMKQYCEENELNVVPLIYYGYAENFVPPYLTLDNEDDFRQAFLEKLETDVQGKECKYNKGLPKEGYVIKIDGINESTAFKYKNIDFLARETKIIDSGEVDIESSI